MTILKSTEVEVSKDIRDFLVKHQEVLIITADPDFIIEGESTIAVYSKLLDSKGVITPMLNNILQNLIVTKNGKCDNIKDQTAINT